MQKKSSVCIPKEQSQEDNTEIIYNQTKMKKTKSIDNPLDNNKIDIIEDDDILETIRTDKVNEKVSGEESADKKKKKSKLYLWIENNNAFLTLALTLALVAVGALQYMTYNRQADIATNANILAQYQYRFDFYQKICDLQKEVSVIKKEPHLDIEQLSKSSYDIVALIRESSLLFDKDVSDDINKTLNEHLEFITKQNDEEISYTDYKNEMRKLVLEYGGFLNNDEFKKYIDLNAIK